MESVRERDSQDIVRGASSPPIFVGFSGQVPPSCPETRGLACVESLYGWGMQLDRVWIPPSIPLDEPVYRAFESFTTNNFEGEVVFIKETKTDIGQIQQGQEDQSEGEAEQEEANGEGKT